MDVPLDALRRERERREALGRGAAPRRAVLEPAVDAVGDVDAPAHGAQDEVPELVELAADARGLRRVQRARPPARELLRRDAALEPADAPAQVGHRRPLEVGVDLADFPLQRAALPREPPPGPREAVGAGGAAAGRGRRPRPAALLRRGRVPRVERPRPQQRRRRRRRVVVALAQAVGGARRRRPAERRERHVLGRRRVVAVGVEAEGLGRGLEVPPGPRVGGRARRRRELVGLRVAAVDDEAGAAEEAAAPRRLALAPRRVERERGDARRGDAPLARAADREPHVDRAARGVDGRHLGEAALEVLAHARQRRRHDERAHGERRRRRVWAAGAAGSGVRRRLGRVRWRLGCVRLRIRRGVGAHVRLRGRLVRLRGRLVGCVSAS